MRPAKDKRREVHIVERWRRGHGAVFRKVFQLIGERLGVDSSYRFEDPDRVEKP